MKLWKVFEKETGKSCTTRTLIEDSDIGTYFEKDSVSYVKWLETKLQNTSSDSDYMSPSAKLKKLAKDQKSLTPEMIDIINENFWELF